MKSKPPLLPEENGKRRTQPAPRVGTKKRARWMLWLALFILSIGFAGSAGVVLYRPEWMGLRTEQDISLTSTAFASTAGALGLTANALEATGQANAQVAFANNSTQAALDNQQMMLDQQGTQIVADNQATQNAVAVANAQQGTRAAVDFQGTQVAFDRAATQVELAYQGTQAALNRDATSVALGFATAAPPADDILTQTPPATQTAMPLFTDGFDTGITGNRWRYSAVEDWSVDAEGNLIATRSGAWLLTQTADFQGYILEAELLPLQGAQFAANYHLLLNVQAEATAPTEFSGIALRISYDGARVTAVGLHYFTLQDLFTDNGLLNAPLTTIQAEQITLDANPVITIRAEVRDNQVIVVVNERLVQSVLLDALPAPGAVGLQVPSGVGIVRVALLE